MSDLKINIHSRNDNNTILDKNYPKFEEARKRLKSIGGSNVSKKVKIVFEPTAVAVLFESIGWGRKYRYGDVEQAGMLIGNYYRDLSEDSEMIWGDVVTVVPADPGLVDASFDTINITSSAWRKMYDDAAEYRTENLQIIGWYHTHLADISTRFSAIDRTTQSSAFTYDYSFGVVFNSHQEKWSVFYGPNSEECMGELIFDEALEAKYSKPQIMIKQISGDSELQEDGTVVHLNEEGQPIYTQPEVCQPKESLHLSKAFAMVWHQFGDMVKKSFNLRSKKPKRNHTSTIYNNCGELQIDTMKSPKIIIKRMNLEEPKICFHYFSYSPEDEDMLRKIHDFKYEIMDDDIMNIVKNKREITNNEGTDQYVLYGEIQEQTSDSMKLLVQSNKHAHHVNTQIRFSNNTKDSDIVEFATRGFQSADLIYVIVINDTNPQKIEVFVVHYSRGKLI